MKIESVVLIDITGLDINEFQETGQQCLIVPIDKVRELYNELVKLFEKDKQPPAVPEESILDKVREMFNDRLPNSPQQPYLPGQWPYPYVGPNRPYIQGPTVKYEARDPLPHERIDAASVTPLDVKAVSTNNGFDM